MVNCNSVLLLAKTLCSWFCGKMLWRSDVSYCRSLSAPAKLSKSTKMTGQTCSRASGWSSFLLPGVRHAEPCSRPGTSSVLGITTWALMASLPSMSRKHLDCQEDSWWQRFQLSTSKCTSTLFCSPRTELILEIKTDFDELALVLSQIRIRKWFY